MDIALNVLGGFLAALAFALATLLWRELTKPLYIPFDQNKWSEETRELLRQRADVDLKKDKVTWVIDYDREDCVEQGYSVVTVGTWPFRREVRTRRKDGNYAVLMRK